MSENTELRPAVPLLYLDVDDEITSAAARIRSAEAEEVALVLPYGSRLATSRINFRLLAREASERGKKIEIICADASARALATAAGLPVHASVAAFEGHRAGVPPEGASGGDAIGNGTGGSGGATGGALAGAVASAGALTTIGPGTGAVTILEPAVDDDTRTRVMTLPRRSMPRVPLVGPARPPVRPAVAVGIGAAVIALVIVGGLLALELLPSATIVLAPRSEEIGPIALTIEARPDVAAPDPATLVIPAQRVTYDLVATQTITATGVKVSETKATGNVTFSNLDTSSGNTIAAGAIVKTESGVEFRTLFEVNLPSAFLFPFFPSTSSVAVEAVEAGETGNVAAESLTVVPKGESRRLLQVVNREATAGGSHVETPEISQADVDGAMAALDEALAADLQQKVEAGAGVPAGVTTFPKTSLVGEVQYSPDPATLVGSADVEAELGATAQGTVLGVDPNPVQAVAEARLQARVTEGWTLAPGSTTYDLGSPSVVGDVVTFPVSIGATQVHDVDEAALVGQIRGLGLPEARARLDDFGDVEVTLWPDWVTTIPKNADRIAFTLAEPRPAPSPTP